VLDCAFTTGDRFAGVSKLILGRGLSQKMRIRVSFSRFLNLFLGVNACFPSSAWISPYFNVEYFGYWTIRRCFKTLSHSQGNRISFLELALQAASQQVSFQSSAVQMRSKSRLII
jgi:hypothetical protein